MPDPLPVILTALTLLLGACAAPWNDADDPDATLADIPAPAPFVDQRPEPDPASRGVELRLLTVDDSGSRVARALAPYATAPALPDEDLASWRAWGLRWVAVPLADLDALLESQRSVGAIENRWMGEFPRWRALVRAAPLDNDTVRVQDAPARTITGRPRLLARAWTTPRIDDDGRATSRVAIDLALQLVDPDRRTAPGQLAPTQPIDQGQWLGPRPVHLELDGSSALVLVADDPDTDWTSDTFAAPPPGDPGPRAPALRTLGERMLSTRGTGTVAPGDRYVPPRKVLIVLVPRTDPGYALLPADRTQERAP